MGKFAGGLLRTVSTCIYFLEFLCTVIALGIFSYFLSKLSYHHLPIAQKWRAVEGISGSGVLYTIFAIALTFFLGAKPFFAIIAIVLDALFCGAFIAVAILTADGASSCTGVVTTPLGVGNQNDQIAGTRAGYACKLNTAVFAVSLIAALLFFFSLIVQLLLLKHHKKEKLEPTSYMSSTGRRNLKFWRKEPKIVSDVHNGGVVAGRV